MQWRQLAAWILELACGRKPHDVLVLHLGENDIPMGFAEELANLIVVDLHCFSQILPAS